MHKIFYIKKETLCALLLPTLHNPPVLFSAWREFSTLDRSWHQGCWDVQVPRAMSRVLKCGPRTRFSSQGPQRHWGQVKSSKIAAPLPLFLHTRARAHARTHTAKSIVRKAGQSVSGGEMRGPRRHLRWVSGAERCAFTEPAGGQAAFLHFSPHFW